MKRVKRIEENERRFDACREAVDGLLSALDKYEKCLGDLSRLTDYYGSGTWLGDFEADEAGKLPPDLKRGVLSEDGVYNMLENNREAEIRMLGVLTRLAKMRTE